MGGSLAIGRDAIYVARTLPGSDAEPVTNGLVAAYSRVDGKQLWEVRGHPFSDILFGSAGVYTAAGDSLYALDPQSGATLWTKQFSQVAYLNALLSSTLYFLDSTNAYALDIGTQMVRWRFPVTYGYMVYADGLFCVGSHGHLSGVDAATGAQVWAQQSADGYAGLAADDGNCYSTTFAQSRAPLTAFDLHTGAQRWQRAIVGIYGKMYTSDGMLFALSDSGAPSCCSTLLIALSASDGSQAWQLALGASSSGPLAIG
jgi:outer membrane protein assembly factor BamB